MLFSFLLPYFVAGILGALFLITFGPVCLKASRTFFKKYILPKKRTKLFASVALISIGIFLLSAINFPLHFAMPPSMQSHAPGGLPASLPVWNALKFIWNFSDFEQVQEIGLAPDELPQPLTRTENETVEITLTAKEVIGEVVESSGIYFNYWTYNGQVPGPFLRVKEGDTVELTLTNDVSSLHAHNIDLHAVTGPGGGASVTNVNPGESKTFRWKAMNPGLYEYHCATPNVSTHNAHGQYGLIFVEPAEGLAPVDKEFYLMQGELYTQGGLGEKGLVVFNSEALLDGNPTYIFFNGEVDSVPRMKAKVGDRIRLFMGNGGINLIASFHVIGEIFDLVYPEGAIGEVSSLLKNVQTTAVLPGGSAMIELTLEVPGKYILVDHALARMNKGAWMILEVEGEENPEIFQAI